MFRAFWEKVRPSLSVWLNANKTGFVWFGKQCARFGRWCASLWIGAVAVYYIIVSLMRFGLIKQYRNNLKRENDREQRVIALKSYRFCGVLMFILNIAVSGLVVQLIWKGETYQYPGFLIYAFAAYSFYCIGMAVRNMAKHRKLETPVLAAAKMLSFACALMSILATQTAMLTQFGGGCD